MLTNSDVTASIRQEYEEQHRRSFLKAISWRITGSIDTFLISFIVTGTFKLAGTIAATEVLTKVGLYYLHERAWNKIKLGKSYE